MNPKLLGLLALLGAPCLTIGLTLGAYVGQTPWLGVWGVLYISGWMAGLIALRELGVFDANTLQARRFGHTIVRVMLVTLMMANLSNVWEMIAPTYQPVLLEIVGLGWPLSNLLMLPLGVAVVRAGRLRGWQRWVPLVVGGWLPIVLLTKNVAVLSRLPLIYSTAAWTLLAVVVLLEAARQQREHTISGIALRDEVHQTLTPPTDG